MNFIDVQLPMAVVRDLRRRGHSADRVVDLIPPTSSDSLILTLASIRRAAIMTKDEDFVRVSLSEADPVPIVRFRCGNISNADLLKLVDRQIDGIVAALQRREWLIEVR